MSRIIVGQEARADALDAYRYYYRTYPGNVFVVAIMHGKQRPGVWKARVRSNEPG